MLVSGGRGGRVHIYNERLAAPPLSYRVGHVHIYNELGAAENPVVIRF